MKKIFTYSFLLALCFSCFASCTKDVKAPAKTTSATTSTYSSPNTQTTTTTQTQAGHTCGGHSSDTGGGH